MKPLRIGLSQISQKVGEAFYFPYSVGLLQAYILTHTSQVDKYDFLPPIYQRMTVSEALDYFDGADVVGFSLYVWNEQRSFAIAKALKERDPQMLIVFGGPQVPDHSEGFLEANPFIDLVCHGPGERAFFQVLEAYPKRDWDRLLGVSYLIQGKFFSHPQAPRAKDLSEFPSPYLTGVFDPLLKENNKWVGMLETNRGCPFSCSFCDWGSATQSKIYRFPLERVESEIEWMGQNKVLNVFVCDANFGILKRDIEIAKKVAQTKEKYAYPLTFQTQTAKNATNRVIEVNQILLTGGLSSSAAISLQSVNPKTLEAIRRENISLETYRQLQNFAIRKGIFAYTDMIMGLPGETYQSFVDGVNTVIENGQHNSILFHDATILPNAEMASPEYRQRYGLKTATVNLPGHTPLNDGIPELMEIIIATSEMSESEWRKAHVFAWMTNFLYYNHKLLQPTLMVLHDALKISYSELIESFLAMPQYPTLSKIRETFEFMALNYQLGYNLETSKQLGWSPFDGVYLPPDLLLQIQLVNAGLVPRFYLEIQAILQVYSQKNPEKLPQTLVEDLIAYNYNLFVKHFSAQRFPIPTQTLTTPVPNLKLHYPLEAFLNTRLSGESVTLLEMVQG